MAQRPQLGVILDDTRNLSLGKRSDAVDFVALRSTMANMPRAAGARSVGEQMRKAHPGAQIALYGWHFLTHVKSDGLAAKAARKVTSREFGHLRDAPGVDQAWDVTKTALEAANSRWLILRTPPSFSTGQVSRDRLAAFAAARKQDGFELLWAPEGLWTDVEALAVGRACGVEVLVSARFDRIDQDLEGAWLRIDGELRPSSAEQLAFAVEELERQPPLLFAGPRAHANLRNFARAAADG